MMRLLHLAIVTSALLTAHPSVAGTILFEITQSGELPMDFGLDDFEFFGDVDSSDVVLTGAFAEFMSGPLLDLQIDDMNGETTYTYGPGTLSLELTALDAHDDEVNGSFTAESLGFSFTVCEGCDDLFGGGVAPFVSIALGAGRFDDNIARAFGILPATDGGGFDIYLENIDGGPYDAVRRGWDAAGIDVFAVGVTEVPEPGLTVLSAIAGIALIRWRRARRG